MPTQSIDAQAQKEFLEGFSGQHRSWLVTVEAIDADGEPVTVIDGLPLQQVSVDDEGAITIAAGADDDEERRSHRVSGPIDLLVDRVDSGPISGLRLVTSSGETIVSFRTAMPPELVDGMV